MQYWDDRSSAIMFTAAAARSRSLRDAGQDSAVVTFAELTAIGVINYNCTFTKGNQMLSIAIEFANLLLASLLVGAMFGIWLSFNPVGLSAGAYVAQQQHGIRTLKVVMPLLGGTTTLLTIVAAVLAHNDQARLVMLAVAAACFVAVGLITRLLNQPINAIVITWSADAPPTNWTEMRDRWWRGHVARTIIGMGGLCLVIAATLTRACPY